MFLSFGIVVLQKRLKNTDSLTALASKMPVKCRYLEGRTLTTPVKYNELERPGLKTPAKHAYFERPSPKTLVKHTYFSKFKMFLDFCCFEVCKKYKP